MNEACTLVKVSFITANIVKSRDSHNDVKRVLLNVKSFISFCCCCWFLKT